MSVVAPKFFQSTDSGAPTLSGTAGDLVELFSSCLIVRKAFSAVSGGSFLDRTTESRLQGGTPFTMMQTPGTSDEFYVGMCLPFERISFTLGTNGVGGTYVWEYWNGSTWTSFSPTDGTSGFTASGVVSWSIASLTSWTTTAVNSSTIYWIRVRLTVANSTNPTVNSLTCTGWSEAFSAANIRVYQVGGGNQFYLKVQDDGNTWGTGTPSTATTKEALVRGAELYTAISTSTNDFPLVSQVAQGIIIRKSSTADSSTRVWDLTCDDRTIVQFSIFPGGSDTGSTTIRRSFAFGDFYSRVSSDGYRTGIWGRLSINSGATDSTTNGPYAGGAISTGHYKARGYTGLPGTDGSINTYSLADSPFTSSSLTIWNSNAPIYPNGPDNALNLKPILEMETVTNIHQRGRRRGVWVVEHNGYSLLNDGDTFSGTGTLSGRTFRIIKGIQSGASEVLVIETSDTWDTN